MQATLIFYVPPHGLPSTLQDMLAVLGPERRACVARELTKVHEDFARGSLLELSVRYAEEQARGEVTVVVAGSTEAELVADARGEVCSHSAWQLQASSESMCWHFLERLHGHAAHSCVSILPRLSSVLPANAQVACWRS